MRNLHDTRHVRHEHDTKGIASTMPLSSTRKRVTAKAARAGLVALLLAGGIGAYQGVTAHTTAHAYAASPKPDWRVDIGNTGAEAVNGPATTPISVFNANPGKGAGVIQGIELDANGNVLFTKGDGFVYSYAPASTQNWVVNTGSSFGSDTTGPASNPVASSDGNVYISTDQGNIYRINAASGTSAVILNTGTSVQQTLKLDDTTGNLFFGDLSGNITSINKSTTPASVNYQTAAAGSSQDGTLAGCAANTTSNGTLAKFYGEGALDASDNFYVASVEPRLAVPRGKSCPNTTLGSLYKVDTTGVIVAKAPLPGGDVSAVALVLNAAVAGGSELVVDTLLGYVEAFATSPTATTLTKLWAVKVADGQLTSSPLVDAARNRVYVADNNAALFARNLTTGAADTAFNGGQVGLTGGTQSSPVLDAAGNVYVVDSTGQFYSFDPSGATRYTFNTNVGTGFFSPAIATDGTVYVGGNLGQVSGFSTSAPPNTPTVGTPGTGATTTVGVNTATPTTGAASATATPTTGAASATPSATSSSTATTVNGATAIAGTPTASSGQAPGWSKFRSNLHNDGGVSLKLDLSQPPGILFTDQLSPNSPPGPLYDAPAIGPSPDGNGSTYRIYQIDDTGRLVAIRPDGSMAWSNPSPAVLGTYHIAGSTPFFDYRPGSPAIGGDGAIYAVSSANYPNGDSGIWRFDPQNGSPTKFFARGTYLGASPAIGPDGAVYAGDKDGNVYAINKDGSQRYAYTVTTGANGDCPGGTSPVVQSAPALDKAGNLYVGYGCGGASQANGNPAFQGGVLALSPAGNEIWHYHYMSGQGRQATQGSEVVNAVVLSPDEQTVYASGYFNPFFALNAANGAPKWTFTPTGISSPPSRGGSIVLSPDGTIVYASFTQSDAAGVAGLYALRASDGSVAGTAAFPNTTTKSPAVDGNGNLVIALDDGEVLAYGPGLGSPLFSYSPSGLATYLEGPVIGPDGSIFLTDNLGNLRALKQGLIVPPSPTPIPTPPPLPTSIPPATFTPAPPIAIGGGCSSVATGTASATAVATATPCPTSTVTPTTRAGTSGAGTSGAGTPGAGSHGTPTPTGKHDGTPTPVTKQGHGYKISVSTGFLTPGDLVRVRVDTTSRARISYTLQATYEYPKTTHAPRSRAILPATIDASVGHGTVATNGTQTVSSFTARYAHVTYRVVYPSGPARTITAVADRDGNNTVSFRVSYLPPRLTGARATVTITATQQAGRKTLRARPYALSFTVQRPTAVTHGRTKLRRAFVAPVGQASAALVHVDAVVEAKATPTPSHTTKGKSGSVTKGKPVTKSKPVTKPAACPIAATIRDRGTLRFTRTADSHGVDQYCVRIAVVPARATSLRLGLSLQVIAGSHTFPADSYTYVVQRPRAKPQVVKSRAILPAAIDASVGHGTVTTNGTETIRSFTARYAHVTYRIVYQRSQFRTITAVADRDGNNTVSFRVSYLPLRSAGEARASVTVTATQQTGRKTLRARPYALSFVVRRPDVKLSLRTVGVRVAAGTIRTGAMEQVDTVSARGASLTYMVSYSRGVQTRYSGHADGSGYATLRFHVQYAPARGRRVPALLTVTAVQGRAHASNSARFYVQG